MRTVARTQSFNETLPPHVTSSIAMLAKDCQDIEIKADDTVAQLSTLTVPYSTSCEYRTTGEVSEIVSRADGEDV